MKNLLTLTLIFISLLCSSQTTTSTIVKDTVTGKVPQLMQLKSGSCGSPDGGMNSTIILPPSHPWLQANGYCNPAAYGNTPTVCWTFTPTSSSVSINSGYSQTGCNNIAFGAFNLFNGSCTLIGTGLNFTGLTPGNTYTWCMTGNAWGGGPSCLGFDDFCPYFLNNVVLPIELVDFYVINRDGVNNLSWVTVSEINNDYFTIENSIDGYMWNTVGTMKGAGNSNTGIIYDFDHENYIDTVNYYRLTQTDFDGNREVFKIISIDNSKESKTLIRTVNLMGQDVDEYYKGIIINVYSDGTTEKVIKQ